MTTIAYNHKDKEIAFDSRCTCGDLIVSDSNDKIERRDGINYVCAGDLNDIADLVDNIDTGMFITKESTAEAFFFKDGKAFRAVWPINEQVDITELTSDRATGTGRDFALAALDFGRTAKQAVEYAKTRDIYTGGKVRVIKVK